MRLATIIENGDESPVVVDPARGVVRASAIGAGPDQGLLDIIRSGRVPELVAAAAQAPDADFRPVDQVAFTAPYRHPRLIWGIGLNYMDHAADLSESVPEEPASFVKGDHTIIGPGEPIPLPPQ